MKAKPVARIDHPMKHGKNGGFAQFYCRMLAYQTFVNYLCVYSYSSKVIHRHCQNRDDVIKWKNLLRYCLFGAPVNSPHKGQWRGPLMFSSICAWINSWVNNREAGDLRRRRAHYDVIVMMAWLSQAPMHFIHIPQGRSFRTVRQNMDKIQRSIVTRKCDQTQTMCINVGINKILLKQLTALYV